MINTNRTEYIDNLGINIYRYSFNLISKLDDSYLKQIHG